MTGMRNPQISVVIIISFILVGGLFLGREQIRTENTYFQGELSSFLVPTIMVGGREYSVENGEVSREGVVPSFLLRNKVLRIAWYSVVNRLDPIFALEGTDPERLEKSVEFLAASLDDFAPLYTPEDEALIRESLYPLNFLRTLAKLETLRQSLVTAPYNRLTLRYNEELIHTMQLYTEDLERLTEAWNELSTRDDLAQRYNFFGGYSYIETYIHTLNALGAASLKKGSLAQRRWTCYRGNLKSCFPLQDALDKNKIFVEESFDTIHKHPHPRDEEAKYHDTLDHSWNIQTNKDIILRYLLSDINKHEFPQRRLLVVLNQSICFPHASPVRYLGWWTPLDKNLRQFQIAYVNDLFFWELVGDFEEWYEPYTENIRTRSRALKKGGIDFQYQKIANIYMCPDSVRDISQVLQIYNLQMSLITNPHFRFFSEKQKNTIENVLSKKSLLDLINLEKKIVTGDSIYQSDIETYLRKLFLLLEEYGEVRLAQLIGSEKVLFIEKLLSHFHQGSLHINEIIVDITQNNYFLKDLITSGSDQGIDYLFAVRSYPMVFFFGFNKSFTEDEISFLQYAYDEPGLLHLFSYNNVLKDRFTADEIVEEMRIERELWKVESSKGPVPKLWSPAGLPVRKAHSGGRSWFSLPAACLSADRAGRCGGG